MTESASEIFKRDASEHSEHEPELSFFEKLAPWERKLATIIAEVREE